MRNNKGFTLIELIMVTIILGILAAVAVPRYLGTVSKAEEAAEDAVVNALRAAVENHSTQQYLDNGRYRYPQNPFDLVDVDGYVGVDGYYGEDQLSDGDWLYDNHNHDDATGYGSGTIYHKRRDNSVYAWDYSYEDLSDGDSDDRGYNVGDENQNGDVQTYQGDLSNNN
tara:strand:- start:1 stop:507 length:507 start_codon:yes stop_codon:yes gene_type:complete